jgi:chromosome segregation ATPase
MSDAPHPAEDQPQRDEMMQRLETLQSQLNSEAGLRAMMDLDQATLTTRLDAQDNLLRALSVTQSDHTRSLTRMEDRLTDLSGACGHLAQGQIHLLESQTRLETNQTRLETKVAGIETRMAGIETKVAGIDTRMAGIDTKVAGIDTKVAGLEAGQSRMETSLRTVLTLLQAGSG